MQRRRLDRVVLTEHRSAIRLWILRCAFGLSSICSIALGLEQHQVRDGAWHGLTAETLGVPLASVVAASVAAVWAVRAHHLWSGLVAGLANVLAGIVVFGYFIATHLFDSPTFNFAGKLGLLLALALPLAGLVILLAEPILRVRERRHLERGDPVFPTARVVERRQS